MNPHLENIRNWVERILVRIKLVGHHSSTFNRLAWSNYDWSAGGEEWTVTAEWKAALVDHAVVPYVRPESHILEIGPGAGRWTSILLARAAHVYAVDVSPVCVEQCEARFKGIDKLSLFLNNGASLRGIGPNTIDVIWSFDVFVHLSVNAIEKYVKQFPRVLKSGGIAVIHHARAGAYHPGWRSNVTANDMRRIARRSGMTVLEEIESLGRQPLYAHNSDTPDVISILKRA